MLRAFSRLSHIAPALLVALLAPASALAQAELELPSPADATSVRAIAVRAELSPRPDGALQATVSLTLLNPEAETQELLLAAGGDGASVTRAGEPVRLTASGSYKLRLEAAEVAVLQVSRRIRPAEKAFLAAEDAGWLGEARGPLLQPTRRVTVAHPAGSPWSAAALEVRLEPGAQLLACSLMATEGALAAEDGSVTWTFAAGAAPADLSLAWPAIENETFLPIDAREAGVFESHWTSRRGIATGAVRLVRSGILAVHGEPLDDEKARRAFDPGKRPGWAPIPGPPTRSEREALATLAAFADRLELAGAPRVVAAAPRLVAPPRRSPAPERTATEPTRRRPTVAIPAPREPAKPPAVPARRSQRAAGLPAPDLENADTDELVTRATDASWRGETLFQTESSVPASPERAHRWARRALRGGHGVSRAVLARESVAALHGKTWAPGFVAEFFSRKPWYRADPGYDFEDLSGPEQAAWKVLDSLIVAVRDGSELAPEQPAAPERIASRQPAARRGVKTVTPGAPTPVTPAAPPSQDEPPAGAAAPKPSGSPVPWLQNPAQARIFMFKERARGLDRSRIALAIATIEARHGKPFEKQPAHAEFFEQQAWYRPHGDYGPEQLSIPARESITLLHNALDAQTY